MILIKYLGRLLVITTLQVISFSNKLNMYILL